MMATGTPGDKPPARRRARAAQSATLVAIDDAQLTLKTVLELTGLSKSTVYKLIRAGDFPAPFHVTARAVRWRAHEIREWLRRKGADYSRG